MSPFRKLKAIILKSLDNVTIILSNALTYLKIIYTMNISFVTENCSLPVSLITHISTDDETYCVEKYFQIHNIFINKLSKSSVFYIYKYYSFNSIFRMCNDNYEIQHRQGRCIQCTENT